MKLSPLLKSFAQRPIPYQPEVKWKHLPIRENDEKLVGLKELAREHPILSVPQYYQQGIPGALPECFVRQQVARRLERAAALLPAGWQLVVWDGWRPVKVQEFLFQRFASALISSQPQLSPQEQIELVSTYVAAPSAAACCPSPHLTGGAVDVTLRDDSGHDVAMGTEFDEFSEKAHTRFYEEKQNLNLQEQQYLHNRRILYWVMREAGFSNYANEWWHFDYGNQLWAAREHKPQAFYGPVSITKTGDH